MQYHGNVIPAEFVSRPNRFIASVRLNGNLVSAHVKNTGRCRELLIPGSTVYLAVSDNPARKTKYDLICVKKGSLLVNLDSQVANDAAEEWLRSGDLFPENAIIRREVPHGLSRFDFFIESGNRKIFLEVKGVTLEKNGVVLFPDAPTQRGVKHLNELAECIRQGFEAYVLFIVQIAGMKLLRPNDDMHPAFGNALRQAAENGVKVLAMSCRITPDSITVTDPLPVDLQGGK